MRDENKTKEQLIEELRTLRGRAEEFPRHDEERESRGRTPRKTPGLHTILQGFDGFIYVGSRDYRIEFMNNRLIERTGYDGTGGLCYEVLNRRTSVCPWCRNESVFRGETVRWEMNSPKDGKWFYVVGTPICDQDGVVYKQSIMIDITDRKRMEETLVFSEERQRLFREHVPFAIAMLDREMRYLCASRRWVTQYKLDNRDLLGLSHYEAFPRIPERWKEVHRRALAGETVRNAEDCITRANGCVQWLRWEVRPWRQANGEIGGIVIFGEDITERKLADQESEKLRKQLFQAQKMETVGRLAGGVAHDFNNMLGVIMGYTDLALNLVSPEDRLHANLQKIQRATEKAADIIRQLLAFARKQMTAPVVLDLNETVESMLKILHHLLGEDIDIVWKPRSEIPSVRMDPTQLDQILANLCINTRDAIGGVGKITIETNTVSLDEAYCSDHADVFPGEFVMLIVSDDGCGMDKQILDNLFEPFFTTKDRDKGTGLGLSTVYGIVKQNGGFINVYSEVDHGTTFKIYFPSVHAEVSWGEKTTEKKPNLRGSETILLVEDDESILALIKTVLEDYGYSVLATDKPSQALKMALSHLGPIHLLITDVLMPEMNGKELRNQLQGLQHEFKCIYMSGYTYDVIAHQGVIEEEMNFLQKPFSVLSLLEKVRDILDMPIPPVCMLEHRR